MAFIKDKRTSSPWIMHGGPLDNAVLWLESGNTLKFTMNGETGRYDGNGDWVPSTNDNKESDCRYFKEKTKLKIHKGNLKKSESGCYTPKDII